MSVFENNNQFDFLQNGHSYSYKSQKFWCHLCQKACSKLRGPQLEDVFCETCSAPLEEITPQNDPRSFQIYDQANTSNNSSFNTSRSQSPTSSPNYSRQSYSQQPIEEQQIFQQWQRIQAQQRQEEAQRLQREQQERERARQQNAEPAGLIRMTILPNGSRIMSIDLSNSDPSEMGGVLGGLFNPLALMGGLFGMPSGRQSGGGLDFDQLIQAFLANDPNNHGPAPAEKEKIEKLQEIEVQESNKEEYAQKQCSICFDDYKEGDKLKQMPCEHNFHKDCVSEWLNRHNSCPCCRQAI